jgi:UDP-N-acetyl-D-mannosaminuronic acid dehydrogenase
MRANTSNVEVCVVGLGYIGLPTAIVLAKSGFNVVGVDIDQRVVEQVSAGILHFVEPGLEGVLQEALASGKLTVSNTMTAADVYLICVPTPFRETSVGDKIPDLSYVMAAADSVSRVAKNDSLIILESTSPVGTTEGIRHRFESAGMETGELCFAYCPERVLPGNVLHELIHNDRVVGGVDSRSTSMAAEFYERFVIGAVARTDARTAELCKLTENSFRDVNIAFANELSLICAESNVDVWTLIELANRHPRVNILQPGVGVGGHCIAVDPWFIVSDYPSVAPLIRTARGVNDGKTAWVVSQIAAKLNACRKLKRVVCLGLAFKPDIDDLRGSPALIVAKELIVQGISVKVVEPNVDHAAGLDLISMQEAMDDSDALLVVLVKHRQFCTPEVRRHLGSREVIDFCGALN